ncbi:MAG: zinc-dependent metalloprotease [Thermoanaerobaculia bacterium]
MSRLTAALFLTTLALSCASVPPATSPAGAEPDPIAERTKDLVAMDGFLPLYWNEDEGKLLLEIPRAGIEMIYQVSLAAGVGHNTIGLDRGQLGPTYLVRFDRVGPKVLMAQPNLGFRAIDGTAGELEAVEESFATSILWAFPIEAERDGRLLVDATEFFLRDAHGVADRLLRSDQGNYRVDADRSAIYLANTKVFPNNTEVEATITLTTSDRPGPLVRAVAPEPQAITVRQHHSFVELPPPGYEPRRLDPRAGFFGIEIHDYASPIDEPIEKRFIARHRLEKKDPGSAVSEAVEPIIYYVDDGVPEPIRSALVEGASWWKEAFEAAGFRNAFDVRILPEDADPMDIRYNVINWVHRSTRGWSYGAAVVDPRTGEILKGNVSLRSLRIRQDVLLASGLIPPYEGPNPQILSTLDPPVSPTEMALGRIRQLAAHEVGHTLGIAHNFAASTYDRASVMDYPAPLVKIRDGKLDLSDAYARGAGAFDVFAVRWGYGDLSDEERERLIEQAIADGMLFVADQHGRDPGTAHPLASVWDNGSDPLAMLEHEMEVRRIAIENFSLANLRPGQPLSELELLFLPLYLHHRYQLEAALKTLGGAYFSYAVRDEDIAGTIREVADPEQQRRALALAMRTLEPAFLAVPERIIDLIPPPAFGYESGTAERFERATEPLFDPIAAARASATITLNALLHPDRAARLLRFHAEDAANPPLTEVTDAVVARVAASPEDARDAALLRAVRDVAVARLIGVSGAGDTDPEVRAVFEGALRELARRLRAGRPSGAEAAHRASTAAQIERFLERPAEPATPSSPVAIPAGPPIGGSA